ncbi:MAG: cytochrome c oxidase subunit 3 [Fimbriimonadaceae bacterium]|nr:cytochrome c oxidase subunit 3 [Fimbriimonadaceae bacterium]QYK56409.1 MAG: cytochrome c oxidase subunit 3 [Fimbriimonadaceae bacterium]
MAAHPHTANPDDPAVYEQFEHIDQQQETYVLGMWAFLVTEVMFFGALFLIYTIYRWKYQSDFFIYHEELNYMIGGLNTFILLISSLCVALAVHYAQLKKYKPVMSMLWITQLCAAAFLVIKLVFEWSVKFEHHLFPNDTFHWNPIPHGGDPEHARVFFSLYFAMTGLHGLHVLIGIVIFAVLMGLLRREHKAGRLFKQGVLSDYVPIEMVGLYWHFVDLVWIFLYPLFYLIPK